MFGSVIEFLDYCCLFTDFFFIIKTQEYENHVCVDHLDSVVPISPWSFVIPDEDGDTVTINIPSNVDKGDLKIPEHVKCVCIIILIIFL